MFDGNDVPFVLGYSSARNRIVPNEILIIGGGDSHFQL